MTKYMILYRAPVSAAEQMGADDPEAAQAGIDAWMAWAQRAGSALVDLGSPLQPVVGGGVGDPVAGYSIMQADSLDSLQEVLVGHPHTEWGGTIDVLEVIAMPGMEGAG